MYNSIYIPSSQSKSTMITTLTIRPLSRISNFLAIVKDQQLPSSTQVCEHTTLDPRLTSSVARDKIVKLIVKLQQRRDSANADHHIVCHMCAKVDGSDTQAPLPSGCKIHTCVAYDPSAVSQGIHFQRCTPTSMASTMTASSRAGTGKQALNTTQSCNA